MMTIEQFLREEQCFKHLKWVEVIQQENLAVNLDSMYIVEKDKLWCDVIFVDSNGNKRKVGGASYEQILEKFALLDLSNLSPENKIIWKGILGGLSAYELAIESGEFIGTEEQWLESLKGDAATIEVGTVITIPSDETAVITNVGTLNNAVFNFEIPKGEQGESATIEVGQVIGLEPNEPPIITNVGTTNDAIFNFSIPKGEKGDKGQPGNDGQQGQFVLEYNNDFDI